MDNPDRRIQLNGAARHHSKPPPTQMGADGPNPLAPSPGQSRGYARANARREKGERNLRILELWKSGMNAAQIARAMDGSEHGHLSVWVVTKIIKRELGRVADERRHIAEEIFDGELERLTTIIRQAWAIINAQCRGCRGAGEINAAVCVTCGGEGKAHGPDTRIKAMKEVRAAIDQRAKMLGLYAPEKFAMTDASGKDLNFHPYLDQLSDTELEKALADFEAGVSAARALAQ